jgi:predicted CoA-substrate-specific enzyme activase
MISLGIDIGSRNTKLVLFDHASRQLAYSAWTATEVSPARSVAHLMDEAMAQTGISGFVATGCTGYGRKLYKGPARIISEISCHAAGVRFFHPEARTVIDIGGQDSKIISLASDGKVIDFVMNDKCAAGTGRFLEMTALRLDCPLEDLLWLAGRSVRDLDISSTCVVFAESEIVGMIADNADPADIARAVNISIAKRIMTQLSALQHEAPIVFTGGVAQNSDLALCLSRLLGTTLVVPHDPEITGALGAAILAIP